LGFLKQKFKFLDLLHVTGGQMKSGVLCITKKSASSMDLQIRWV